MLRPGWCRPFMLAALMLTACSPTQPLPIDPVKLEATYRLTFNDVLVGNSLFVLEITTDGNYRIEAFSTPAGEMQQDDDHGVLETSQGRIDRQGVRAQRFEKSTMTAGQTRIDRLLFDWDNRLQRRIGENGERTDALLPDTQDRLSYLLAASRLALARKGTAQVRIVSTGKTDETRLQVTGEETIKVPFGHHRTVAIRRHTPEPNVIRALWFDTGLSPLPLRVVHGWAGNTVDMQLESLTRQPNHPR